MRNVKGFLCLAACFAVTSALNSTTIYSNTTISDTHSASSTKATSSNRSSTRLTATLTYDASSPAFHVHSLSTYTSPSTSYSNESSQSPATTFEGSSSSWAAAPPSSGFYSLGANASNPTSFVSSGSARPSHLPSNSTNGTHVSDGWQATLSCNAEWQDFSSQYVTTMNLPNVTKTVIYSGSYATFVTPRNATPYTTLCDGRPRASGEASYTMITHIGSYEQPDRTTTTLPHITTPPCSIPPDACAKLWASYNLGDMHDEPGCPTTCVGKYHSKYMSTSIPPCYIKADEVQVAYWPVEVAGDLCGNRSTIAPTYTGIPTASTWGTTIASPGVLVSFNRIWAVDFCSSTLGDVLSGYILPQQTSQISTQCGAYHQGAYDAKQVDFADFNFPYPASAYLCQPQCGNGAGGMENFCSTFYDNFNPQIAFPTDVFNIKPEWKTCKIEYLGNVIHDPPKALTQMAAPAEPTTPNAPGGAGPTTPAAPQQPPPTNAEPTGGVSPTSGGGSSGGDDPADGGEPSDGGPNDGGSNNGGSNNSGSNNGGSNNGGSNDGGPNSGGSNDGGSNSDGDTNNSGGSNDNGGGSNNNGGSNNGGDPSNGGSSNNNGGSNSGGGSNNGGSTGSGGSNSGGSNSGGSDGGTSNGGGLNAGSSDGGSSNSGSNGGSSAGGSNGHEAGNSNAEASSGGNPGAGSTDIGSNSGGSSNHDGSSGSTTGHDDQDNAAQHIGGIIASILDPNTRQAASVPQQTAGAESIGLSRSRQGSSGAVLQLDNGPVTALAVGGAGAVDIAGQTLGVGQVATVDGHVISNAGNKIIVDGSTTAPISRITAAPAAEGAIFTLGLDKVTAFESSGTAIYAGHTLTSGQVLTINGHTISNDGDALVVDGTATAAFSQLPAHTTPFMGEVFTISGQIYTATNLPNGDVVVDGTTLREGGSPITIDGVLISDGPDGLVVGGRTLPPSTLVPEATAVSGHGGFTGAASSIRPLGLGVLVFCAALIADNML